MYPMSYVIVYSSSLPTGRKVPRGKVCAACPIAQKVESRNGRNPLNLKALTLRCNLMLSWLPINSPWLSFDFNSSLNNVNKQTTFKMVSLNSP